MRSTRAIRAMLAPLHRRVLLMVRRGVVRLVDDALKAQGLQVSLFADEVAEAERFQQYGFTAHPIPGAEALVLALGGNAAHPVVIAVEDRRYRLKGLAEGEVALYSDEGDYIHFKRGRKIEILAGAKVEATAPEVEVIASTKVTLTTPLAEISGNLTVGGTAAVAGALSSATSVADPTGTMQGMRDTYNGHTHPGDSGGTTGSPNQSM